MAKPQPVSKNVVCSECGLAWADHKRATQTECIRLLRAELSPRSLVTHMGGSITTPTISFSN